jgi:hypothetical protein
MTLSSKIKFKHEDGGSIFLLNVGILLQDYSAVQPKDGTRNSHSSENVTCNR